MKPYLPILIALALLCPIGHGAPVVSDVSDLSSILAPHSEPIREVAEDNIVSAITAITRAYNTVPICYEYYPYTRRGRNDCLKTSVPFTISKGDPLDRSLDKLVALSNGLLKYRIIHNQIVILPVKQTDDEIVSNLDVRVSVDFEDVSVWVALKRTVGKANRQQVTDYPTYLYPPGYNHVLQPPSGFTNAHEISLTVEHVTAREAVCAVLAASSLNLAYRYSPGSTSDSLRLYSPGHHRFSAELMTRTQIEWWKQEVGYYGRRWIPPGREDMLLESTDDYVAHLGLRISVDLEALSVWEAVKQIVAEVNKQTGYIQPLGVLPEDLRYNESPVPELTDLREITLSMQDVTVQEALDTVVAASSLEISYAYEWLITMSTLTIITLEDGQYREEAYPLTQEEREWWLRERGLRQESEDPPVWILRPLGMDTSFEHHSNGQLIPIPNAAIQKE